MKPHNIVWITCDEMKASAIKPYGNRMVSVPAAERVAREGVLFEQNFAQVPKCIPARPSMLTGRYAHVDGLRTMSTESFQGNGWMTLGKQAHSLIHWLKEDGYKVDIFGKNHWIRPEAESVLLDRLPETEPREVRMPQINEPPSERLQRAYFAGRVDEAYDRDLFPDSVAVSKAIRFMETHQESPFFILLDIGQPHPPYYEWPEFADDIPLDTVPVPPCRPLEEVPMVEQAIRRTFDVEELSDHERRRIVRAYWSQCRFADHLVSRVLDAIERLGLEEETLVIFNSDHGDFAGEHNCYEKWDTSLLDCITRVPLIMRLPGKLPAHHRVAALTEQIDIAPTIMELLGKEVPPTVQGKSLLPVVRGDVSALKDAVFSQGGVEPEATRKPGLNYEETLRRPYWNKQRTLIEHPDALIRSHMVRTDRHKLIYRLSGDHEFYDLQADPDELDNVYGRKEHAENIAALERRLLRFFVENQTHSPVITELWA